MGDQLEAMTMLARIVRCATCEVPYVLRVGLSLATGENQYVLFRDCKCKPREAYMSDDTAHVDDGMLNATVEIER